MDMRLSKRSNDGEPSGSAKHQKVGDHSSGGFASGPAGRRHLLFTNTTQTQEQHELHKIVSNLKEGELIDNPTTFLSEEIKGALLVQRDHKADQAQVVQTDRRSAAGLAEDGEHVGPSEAPKGLEDIALSSFTSVEELGH